MQLIRPKVDQVQRKYKNDQDSAQMHTVKYRYRMCAGAFWTIAPDIMIDFAQICSIMNYSKHHYTGDAKSYASPTL